MLFYAATNLGAKLMWGHDADHVRAELSSWAHRVRFVREATTVDIRDHQALGGEVPPRPRDPEGPSKSRAALGQWLERRGAPTVPDAWDAGVAWAFSQQRQPGPGSAGSE